MNREDNLIKLLALADTQPEIVIELIDLCLRGPIHLLGTPLCILDVCTREMPESESNKDLLHATHKIRELNETLKTGLVDYYKNLSDLPLKNTQLNFSNFQLPPRFSGIIPLIIYLDRTCPSVNGTSANSKSKTSTLLLEEMENDIILTMSFNTNLFKSDNFKEIITKDKTDFQWLLILSYAHNRKNGICLSVISETSLKFQLS